MRLLFIVKEMYKSSGVVPFKVTLSLKAFFAECYVIKSGFTSDICGKKW